MTIGEPYGRLTVLALLPGAPRGSVPRTRPKARVRCVCGTEKVVARVALVNGDTRSCGCLKGEMVAALGRSSRTHGLGHHKTPEYRSWGCMKSRTSNPNVSGWRYWGGRGITVCDRWKSFENFLADMGPRPSGMTLDRIDTNGNYEPGNCRWADAHTQRINQRRRINHRKLLWARLRALS